MVDQINENATLGTNLDHRIATPFLSSDSITKLNTEGHRFKSPAIRLIDECRDAMEHMPQGQCGIVIGSGPNTSQWHKTGWETLDVDPTHNPTYVHDANTMTDVTAVGSYDFVLAERITMGEIAGNKTKVHNPAINNVEPDLGNTRLLEQAGAVLK